MTYSIVDYYSSGIKFIILSTSALILHLAATYLQNHPANTIEYPILFLLAVFFLVAIVGFSLNIYVLLLYDAFNHSSREAAVKYYYLSAFSSGLLATGILISYILFHNTGFLYIKMMLGI
jgi:NADH:ubiquinone oxidoreductase subunit 2 (subunit N)